MTSQESDADGYGALRNSLVGDLTGDILEIGAGIGPTFSYYGTEASVTAIEPNEELRNAAEETAAAARIHVLPGEGEALPFEDASFDAVSASLVLCSVTSQAETLAEFKRVLRPGGSTCLLPAWPSSETSAHLYTFNDFIQKQRT